MRWRKILERHGLSQQELAEGWDNDPFAMLAHCADQAHSTISFSAKSSHPDYGIVSCQIHVTVQCPQDERSINLAAELCFRKAIELLNPAAMSIGAPPLPQMPES